VNGKSEIVIEIKGLRTSIGRQLIHNELDLQVHRGEVLGLVGASGSGKSVLLRTIVGLIQPELGTIEVLGHSMIGISDTARRTLVREFGVLFQEVPLIEHLGMPPALADQIAAVKLALVGLPASAGPKFPSELSGGMRKRAGLARALAADPAILFLDEPTAGLDPIGAAAFDQLIKELQQTLGLTVFIVTHDLDSLVAICDRIAVLADRRVLVIGDFERMLRETHPWVREYFHGPRARAAVRDGR
jgi:phospholipid/cholesterol/gamma-HCH transport system ATP-binding protein